MVLTDEQAQARQDERQWARDMAERLAPTGRAPERGQPKVRLRGAEPTEAELASLEASLRRISCASEFKYRKRHTGFYVVGCLVTSWMEVMSHVIGNRLSAPLDVQALLFLLSPGMNVLLWFVLWRRTVPVCPNCKQNIRTCAAQYCHLCGKPTNHQRCPDCGVDESWTGRLPFSYGKSGWIAYCPGCGVELDTSISRSGK
jgi:hypothetical protein